MDLHKYVVRANAFDLAGTTLHLAHPDFVGQTSLRWVMLGRMKKGARDAPTTLLLVPLPVPTGTPPWAAWRTGLLKAQGVPPPARLEEQLEQLAARRCAWEPEAEEQRPLQLVAWTQATTVSADTRWCGEATRSRAPVLLELLGPNDRPHATAPEPTTSLSERALLDERTWRREKLRTLPPLASLAEPLTNHRWSGPLRAGSSTPWGLTSPPARRPPQAGTAAVQTSVAAGTDTVTSLHWPRVPNKATLDLLLEIEFGGKPKEQKRRRVYAAWLQPVGSSAWEDLPLPLQNLLATGQAPQGTPELTTAERKRQRR
jgi:hypothetical protein